MPTILGCSDLKIVHVRVYTQELKEMKDLPAKEKVSIGNLTFSKPKTLRVRLSSYSKAQRCTGTSFSCLTSQKVPSAGVTWFFRVQAERSLILTCLELTSENKNPPLSTQVTHTHGIKQINVPLNFGERHIIERIFELASSVCLWLFLFVSLSTKGRDSGKTPPPPPSPKQGGREVAWGILVPARSSQTKGLPIVGTNGDGNPSRSSRGLKGEPKAH